MPTGRDSSRSAFSTQLLLLHVAVGQRICLDLRPASGPLVGLSGVGRLRVRSDAGDGDRVAVELQEVVGRRR